MKRVCDRPAMLIRRFVVIAVVPLISATLWAADSAEIEFFETRIRPLLVENCIRCHGAEKESGNLRLDSIEAIRRGGEGGPVIDANDPAKSRLISAVERRGDLAMPPDKELSAGQIAALKHWVSLGAPWPETEMLRSSAAPHWAFEPIAPSSPGAFKGDPWVRTPIDAFVLAKLREDQLAPSPRADRRMLIRRAAFDLTGLPPSPAEVARFISDESPDAWERLIDRLLDSRHYGEKWARHWLDVARYSDSKGYVYAREERFWVHAWTYRDWVVRALNDDMPYDRFLYLQIAADQHDSDSDHLAAMGFLTIGRRFLGVTHDIIDDRIDVVTRGTMGLTVACARCHDHKFDPIPTRDYYSLYGVFRNCVERLVPLAEIKNEESEFAKGLREREQKLSDMMLTRRSEAADRVRARLAEYLYAQTELDKYPDEGFDVVLVETDIIPEFVRRWRDYLTRAARGEDSVFAAWRRFAGIASDQFAKQAHAVSDQLQQMPTEQLHPRVAALFADTPADMREVAARYAKLFAEVSAQYQSHREQPDKEPAPDALLASVLYGVDSPCIVPDEPIVSTERFFTTSECEELWKLRGEVDRWLINSPGAPPQARILVDRDNTVDTRVLVRGNSSLLGDFVPRQFLEVIAGKRRKPFQHGSGRRELASAIIDPANPLTARVAVNRVWMHHFGSGLVSTPSDFGRRADPPSHPELLDWLADRFVRDGWSLKRLHRQIMRSSVYQQDSFGPRDPAVRARTVDLDPENRLLWRMSPRRLTFEEFRDAALSITGELRLDFGGKPVDLFASGRRSLYARIDRQFFPSVLRVFDVANPDLHIARRRNTTIPQQALFFMNHPFLIERAKQLASLSQSEDDTSRVHDLYRIVYQRAPTEREVQAATELVKAAVDETVELARQRRTGEWDYGYGQFDAGTERLVGFERLPFFDGKAWQGGPQWPHPRLGWVQVTAEGGHAGNDKQHAAVRRWTSPRAMRISIKSELVHEAAPGDGIRGFLVSSQSGLLNSAEVHQRSERMDVETLEVAAGEFIDFVVDLRDNLNHEEFLWKVNIVEIPDDESEPDSWNSLRDFGGKPTTLLEPWEQLAQVLLAANEFVFVD